MTNTKTATIAKKSTRGAGQIKSRARVRDRGEVFTAEREVKAMLDLIPEDGARLESTYLEPACGNGNFLVEILARKIILAVEQSTSKSELALKLLLGLSTIYGIDICPENVNESRQRLLYVVRQVAERELTDCAAFIEQAEEILRSNILVGDFLTGLGPDDKPLVFHRWKLLGPFLVKLPSADLEGGRQAFKEGARNALVTYDSEGSPPDGSLCSPPGPARIQIF